MSGFALDTCLPSKNNEKAFHQLDLSDAESITTRNYFELQTSLNGLETWHISLELCQFLHAGFLISFLFYAHRYAN